MAAFRGLLILLLICASSLVPLVVNGERGAVPMKKFAVDLDKPPQERWIDLISHFNSSVPYIIQYFDQLVHLAAVVCVYMRERERDTVCVDRIGTQLITTVTAAPVYSYFQACAL